jgi:histidinol-phosphate aminotransferase
MARHKSMPAKSLYLLLKENGVLVRYFDIPRIDNFLRVTVGTMDEMQTFIKTLKKIVG